MTDRYSWVAKLAFVVALVAVLLICQTGTFGARSGPGAARQDVMGGAVFQLEVEGKLTGTFAACSGIGSTHEVVEYKSGDKAGKEVIQKRPGRLVWRDVTLSRGLSSDLKLWAWRQEVVDGKMAEARKKCTITMMDREARPVAVWELTNGWPSGLTMDAKGGNEAAVEEIVLSHEGAVRRQ